MVLLGLVVDRLITGDRTFDSGRESNDENNHTPLSSPSLASADLTTTTTTQSSSIVVVVDTVTGQIIEILTQTPPPENMELLVFPPNTTLLPGFIDCHVHLTIATDDYQIDHLKKSSAEKALRALKAAQGLLQAGFTTLRSAGDSDLYFPSFAVAKSIENGEFEGPRIVGAGHYISVTGGGGDMNFLASESCSCCVADGVIVDSPDEVVKAVRNEIKYGSDWIKVMVTGAFMSASTGAKDSPENTHFSREELYACVQEAARRQVPVMAHAHGADGIKLAIQAGCRSIEHASFIDDEGIEACLTHGTWIVPTFLIGEYYSENGSQTGAQDRMIALGRQFNERYHNSIQKAVRRGVRVALGSDFVGWDPKITAREFFYLVKHGGMSPLEAIYSGTSSAADMLNLPTIGRILPGCVADLVAVRGNPLDDISLLENAVVWVMRNGKVVRKNF